MVIINVCTKPLSSPYKFAGHHLSLAYKILKETLARAGSMATKNSLYYKVALKITLLAQSLEEKPAATSPNMPRLNTQTNKLTQFPIENFRSTLPKEDNLSSAFRPRLNIHITSLQTQYTHYIYTHLHTHRVITTSYRVFTLEQMSIRS